MRIGLDFGSTYTTAAAYDRRRECVATLSLGQGEISVPSVVMFDDDEENGGQSQFLCGTAAKGSRANGNAKKYEAFKMLLVEDDKEILREKGYTEERTPRDIGRLYLQNVLAAIANRYHEDFDRVVVCVPEIWSNNGVHTLDGRNILREILLNEIKLPGDKKIRDVKVVMEPEAASAFYAYNYEQETNRKFNGYILLIDYGGGTLDLTLTKVVSEENGVMRIMFCDHGGCGENHRNDDGVFTIGSAGIAYMQKVVQLAMTDAGINYANCSETVKGAALGDLERLLKDAEKMVNIRQTFGKYGTYSECADILGDKEELFFRFDWDGHRVRVTYQHLYRAYQMVIEPVLAAELNKINDKVEAIIGADPCQVEAGERDDFKIARVGGFCSFYLVQKQIEEIYNFDPHAENDLRLSHIDVTRSEEAVALGAGLIADDKVELHRVARFSIGFYTNPGGGDKKNGTLSYGIRKYQPLVPGQKYFLLRDNTVSNADEEHAELRVVYAGLSDLTQLAINTGSELNMGGLHPLKQRIIRRFADLPDGMWYCAFSIDEYDVISFHIVPYAGLGSEFRAEDVRLDSYRNMCEFANIETVTVNQKGVR